MISKHISRTFCVSRFRPSTTEKTHWDEVIKRAPSAIICHLTFKNICSAELADHWFRSFTRLVARICKQQVAWIRGEEITFGGLSDGLIRRHYHAVILSHDLSPEGLQALWTRFLGNCKCENYDFARGEGLGYCLKGRNDERVEWTFSDNLFLFVPDYRPKSKRETQMLERLKLTSERLASCPPLPYRGLRKLTPEQEKSDIARYLKQQSAKRHVVRQCSFEDLFPNSAISGVFQFTEEAVKQANDLLETQGKEAMEAYLTRAPRKKLGRP